MEEERALREREKAVRIKQASGECRVGIWSRVER